MEVDILKNRLKKWRIELDTNFYGFKHLASNVIKEIKKRLAVINNDNTCDKEDK